jgi:Tol biopolymer transport system component
MGACSNIFSPSGGLDSNHTGPVQKSAMVFGLASITRRGAVSWLLACLALRPPRIVMAEAGTFSIAIPDFLGGSQDELEKGRSLAQVIVSDLRSSGRFAPLDPSLYPTQIVDIDTTPQFSDWRSVGGQYLVAGQLALRSDERVKVEFRLWDTTASHPIMGVQYFITSSNLPRIPHVVAETIYERLTGQISQFDHEK